jgi:hypothetical protein
VSSDHLGRDADALGDLFLREAETLAVFKQVGCQRCALTKKKLS